MKKIKLRTGRYKKAESLYRREIEWKEGPAFFVNPNGIMIHRVRSIATHLNTAGRATHEGILYFCGNIGRPGRGRDSGFYDDPPADRLLCSHCEAAAIRARQPTADELTGRHVHIGKLRAEKLCCKIEEKN